MQLNLYDILNIEQTSTKKDIIKAYRELVKKYHPDRPTGDSELFELINHAFDVLSNDEKRKNYDNLQDMSNKVNKEHLTRRQEYENFLKLQKESEMNKTIDECKLDFNDTMAALDSKRDFDRKKYDEEQENKLTEDDLKELQKDLYLVREQEDIEYQPENLFKDKNFNANTFNKLWRTVQKKSQLLSLPKNNPDSYNTDRNFVGADNDYGELFSGGTGAFSGANFSSPLEKLTAEDLKDLEEMDDDNNDEYALHNKGRDDKDYKKSLEDLIKEREKETDNLLNMELKDFNTDIKNSGYGFLHEVGFDEQYELDYNDSKDMKERYEKLLSSRKQEDNMITKKLKKKQKS